MKYLLLIYSSEADRPKGDAEKKEMMAEYGQFSRSIRESGKYLAGEALQPIATATTIRVRDGKTLTTDGPFAETREQLGGFYAIEAEDLDEAIAIGARIPGARLGSIEIRPVWVLPPANPGTPAS